METFRTEFLEEIAKRAEIKGELEQSIISFSLEEDKRAGVVEQVRVCAMENMERVGWYLLYETFFNLALPIFHAER